MTPLLLAPAVPLYALLSSIHRKTTRPRTLPRPVISVGNLTWGGTGKTPVVIMLARYLASQNLHPVVLTRGYFRKSGKPLIASDGNRILSTPDEAGDEPCLIAESAPGAGVVVGTDRYAAGMSAVSALNPGVFILDDGFQHWKLARNLDIVCVNALNPLGNGWRIPAGILREPVKALRRADIVIITNADLADPSLLSALEQRLMPETNAGIVHAGFGEPLLRNIMTGVTVPAPVFAEREVAAVSAVGENTGFRTTLEKHGFKVERHIAFRDHYWYNLTDISTILNSFSKTTPVLTTAKDAVKLKPLLLQLGTYDVERFYSFDVELRFLKGNTLCFEKIQNTLRSSLTGTAP